MVVHTARRGFDQLFYRAVGGASSKGPRVQGAKRSRGRIQIERNDDAVLQDERSPRRRDWNTSASCSIQIFPHRDALTLINLAFPVPADQAGMPSGIGEAVRDHRETPGGRGRLEGEE